MPSKEGGNAYHTLFSFRVNYKEYYDRNTFKNFMEELKMKDNKLGIIAIVFSGIGLVCAIARLVLRALLLKKILKSKESNND